MVIPGSTELQLLDQECYNYMRAGRRPNTLRNTRTHAKLYQEFCDKYELQELPANEWQMTRYAIHTATRVKSYNTVENYVSGVRTLQQLAGFESKKSVNFKLAMDGVKCKLAKPVKRATLVTTGLLIDISEIVNYSSEFEFCSFSTMLTGFYLTIRSSNLVPMSTEKFNEQEQLTRWHAGIDPQLKVVTFLIEWSKNNQNKGKELWIPVSRSEEDDRICLVRVLDRYFERVQVKDNDPCFSYHNEKGKLKALTYKQLNEQMKEWARKVGYEGSFTTHALRRGGIRHGIKSGISPDYLRIMGDWSSDSFLKYVDLDVDIPSALTVQFNKK